MCHQVAAYKSGEQLEVEVMRELRVENIEKQQNESEAKYCVCRRAMAGTMLQCALCKDWFHSTYTADSPNNTLSKAYLYPSIRDSSMSHLTIVCIPPSVAVQYPT